MYNFQCLFQAPTESSHISDTSDISLYQTSLEDVLTWLLEADEKLRGMNPLADNIDGIIEQFHEIEVFLQIKYLEKVLKLFKK